MSLARTGLADYASAEAAVWSLAPRDATVAARRPEQRRDPYDRWVRPRETPGRPAPKAQQLTHELLSWTGWSRRALAKMLMTSHPTISALAQGLSAARVGDLFDRLIEAREVVSRVHLIAEGDASRTSHLLTTPSASGQIAKDLLAQRRPAEAYLVALDVLHPRPPGPMMQSVWPAAAGDATIDLAENPV